MTAESASLRPVLETSDMLEIDGLHAFDFELTELKLVITAMDGSSAKENIFTNIDSAAIL